MHPTCQVRVSIRWEGQARPDLEFRVIKMEEKTKPSEFNKRKERRKLMKINTKYKMINK